MSRTPISTRRGFLKLGAAATSVFVAGRYYTGTVLAQVPPLEQKDSYTIGFSQVGSNNPSLICAAAAHWQSGEESRYREAYPVALSPRPSRDEVR